MIAKAGFPDIPILLDGVSEGQFKQVLDQGMCFLKCVFLMHEKLMLIIFSRIAPPEKYAFFTAR